MVYAFIIMALIAVVWGFTDNPIYGFIVLCFILAEVLSCGDDQSVVIKTTKTGQAAGTPITSEPLHSIANLNDEGQSNNAVPGNQVYVAAPTFTPTPIPTPEASP